MNVRIVWCISEYFVDQFAFDIEQVLQKLAQNNLLFAFQGLEGNEEDAAIGMMSDNTARLTSAVRYQTLIEQYYVIYIS